MAYNSSGRVRPPAHAGTFYPASAKELDNLIEKYLRDASVTPMPKKITGIMVPHAGYVYSGPTAAHAYALVAGGPYESVLVIAPSHRELLRTASVFQEDAYVTPFGRLEIDKELAEKIVAQNESLNFSDVGHGVTGDSAEHSLEVQLPFLQKVLPDIPIVPIVLSDPTPELCESVGRAIADALDKKSALIVASTDLYHGYSYDACVEADSKTLDAIESFAPRHFAEGVIAGEYHACGAGPVTAMLYAAKYRGAETVEIVARTNSADITGDRLGYVVGYGAAVVY